MNYWRPGLGKNAATAIIRLGGIITLTAGAYFIVKQAPWVPIAPVRESRRELPPSAHDRVSKT